MKKIITIIVLFVLIYLVSLIEYDFEYPIEMIFLKYIALYFLLITIGFILEDDLKKIDLKKILINIIMLIIVSSSLFFLESRYNIIFLSIEIQCVGLILSSYIVNYIYQIIVNKKIIMEE